ncbi:MAG: diguanylate cyclase [Bacillaceae bacterium]|nr:diguanylate cyclase [Bacillaceae bacterium]
MVKQRDSIIGKEKGILILSIFFALLYLFILFLRPGLFINDFRGMHIFLQFLSVSVAYAIAFEGWLSYPFSYSQHRLYVAAMFLAIGTFDLLYIMTFITERPQILSFLTEMNHDWLWIIARLTVAVFLLVIFNLKDTSTIVINRNLVFSFSILFISIVVLSVINIQFPPLFHENQRPTLIKIGMEILIASIHFLTTIILILQYKKTKEDARLYFIMSLLLLSLSEPSYMFLNEGTWLNVLGDIYKIFGYYFFLKGLHTSTIKEPYEKERKTQEELFQSEARYKRLIEDSPDANIVHRNGKIIYVNKNAVKLIKAKDRMELIGQSIYDFLPEKYHDLIRENMQRMIVNNQIFEQTELTIYDFEKNKMVIEVSAIPTVFGVEPAVHIIFRDITRRKELEKELKEKNEILRHLSSIDGLTGIPNRRSFEEVLTKEWNRNMREDSPLSALMVDIDYFKNFNDHYGHLAGDDCLKQVARTLKSQLKRSSDFIARYGGEEFVILLPGTDQSGAYTVAKELCNSVKNLKIPHEKSESGQYLTVSVGAATLIPDDSHEPKDLINLADQSLYIRKQSRPCNS